MAATGMPIGNANVITRWSDIGFIDMYKKNIFWRAFQDGAVFQATELDGQTPGNDIRFSFTNLLTGIGIGEGGTLQGNEEALTFDNQTLAINVFRHGVNNPNKFTIEQQRTNINFLERATTLLSGFIGSRKDAGFLQQLAGAESTSITVDGAVYTGTDRSFVTGLNTVTAPSANRILRAGVATTDQGLISSETFTVDLIDDALVSIAQSTPTFEPFDDDSFMLICSPQQLLDLQRDGGGSIQFMRDVLRPITEGTGKSELPNINDMMKQQPDAMYRNVKIFTSTRVALGVNSSTSAAVTTTRRAVLLGKNAGVYGSTFGSISQGNTPFKMFSQLTDYDYFKGVEARTIDGFKKLIFNSEDFGVFVLSTYSAV